MFQQFRNSLTNTRTEESSQTQTKNIIEIGPAVRLAHMQNNYERLFNI